MHACIKHSCTPLITDDTDRHYTYRQWEQRHNRTLVSTISLISVTWQLASRPACDLERTNGFGPAARDDVEQATLTTRALRL